MKGCRLSNPLKERCQNYNLALYGNACEGCAVLTEVAAQELF